MKHDPAYPSRRPEYRAWEAMHARCYSDTCISYPHYGARGIKVCERWQSFENFLDDMGPKPSRKHSLDRKDNDGDYTPENCRWATKVEQMNNRTNSRWLEHDGKRMTLAQWARELGITEAALESRLRKGWPLERALTATMHGTRPIAFGGRTQTRTEWARELGISASTLTQRLKRGWSLERTLSREGGASSKALSFQCREVLP